MSRIRVLRPHSRALLLRHAALLSVLLVGCAVFALLGCEGDQGPAGPKGDPGSDVCCAGFEFIGDLSALRADGSSTQDLTVRVSTHLDNPIEGIVVNFAVDSGDGQLSASSVVTDGNGEATTTYTSGSQSGYTVIVASICEGDVTTRDTAQVWVDPLTVTAPLLADGFARPLIGSWSQDGLWITYYQRNDYYDRDYTLYKVSAQGGTPQIVGDYHGGAWNFDGSNRIAAWDTLNNVYVLDSDGTVLNGPFKPTEWPDLYDIEVLTVGWCYDGDSLLVACNLNQYLYVCDTSGNARHGEVVWSNTFSPIPGGPNGVVEGSSEFDYGVWKVDLATYTRTALVTTSNMSIQFTGASVTQNGSTVVFARADSYGAPGTLFTIPYSGGSETKLFNSPMNEMYPVWSPDGTKVLFTSNRSTTGYNLYILDVSSL